MALPPGAVAPITLAMTEPQTQTIETLTIDRLGAHGDGIFDAADGAIFVAGSLAGETVRVEIAEDHNGRRGRLLEVVDPSPHRVAPVCRHFGTCGGCLLQMMSPDAYRDWKRDAVVETFRQRGIEAEVLPVVAVPPASRRRAVFAVRREGGKLHVGFRERLAHTVIDIEECAILRPALIEALPRLRRLAEPLSVPKKGATMVVTETLTGLDVAINDAEFAAASRQSLLKMTLDLGFARLSINGEIIVERIAPQIDIGGVAVAPPPGAFLQAVVDAEAVMADRVLAAVGKAKRVADLFCGVGTFALRLARRAHVHAVESDKNAVAALDRAARFATGLKPLTVEARDLYRRPMFAPELKNFDAVVFDPPRDGAAAQCKELAKSAVPLIVAVSCNPTTLARDARNLIDAGYQMSAVEPIDQFLFTPHIELVATFRKK